MFLRGYGSRSYAQTNGSLNGITTTTYTSNELNVIQGDATRNVTGSLSIDSNGYSTLSGAFYYKGSAAGAGGSGGAYAIGFDLSRLIPTASENRPINIAVRYLIKAQ